jgi:hypothetical protein
MATYFLREIASHGIIVVAVEHTDGTASATRLQDGTVMSFSPSLMTSEKVFQPHSHSLSLSLSLTLILALSFSHSLSLTLSLSLSLSLSSGTFLPFSPSLMTSETAFRPHSYSLSFSFSPSFALILSHSHPLSLSLSLSSGTFLSFSPSIMTSEKGLDLRASELIEASRLDSIMLKDLNIDPKRLGLVLVLRLG